MTRTPEARLRGAVVGAGHMGQYHILALAEIWGVDLVAVVDIDLDKARQVAMPYGVPALRDHRALAGLADFAIVASRWPGTCSRRVSTCWSRSR
jgi:predicted dehydrogenase